MKKMMKAVHSIREMMKNLIQAMGYLSVHGCHCREPYKGGTMKIIIFIIIACTLFVAWSLCIVGASADEQLEMIYAKDLERKEQREKVE